MPLLDVEQRSPAWLKARIGSVTGSRVADVCLKTKSGESEKRAAYRRQVACERMTGRSDDHYVSPYMEDGMEREPMAKTAYELTTGTIVEPVGLVTHPRIPWFASSPDGLVGDDGVIEIKCLKQGNHYDILEKGVPPEKYFPQMLAELSCTERKWCDFVSFHPYFPPHRQLFIYRFERDEKLVNALELEVQQFLSEVEASVEKLR